MIKYIKNLCLISLPLLFIHRDPCLSIRTCADAFAFKVVDKLSQQDLVFGSPSLYSPDSVYLLTNLSGYTGKMSRVDNSEFISTLVIPADTFFLRLTSIDTDTLLISYDYVKTKCCNSLKGYGKIQSIKYNGINTFKEGHTFIFEK